MSDAFVGEIRLFANGWAPSGWLPCDGSRLPITAYNALFAILGDIYGGDGQTYFNLPDLRSRVAPGSGDSPTNPFQPALGSHGGDESVTLTELELPPHTHTLNAATPNVRTEVTSPAGNWIGQNLVVKSKGTDASAAFSTSPPNTTLNPATLSAYTGKAMPHENRQPYMALGYYIATEGETPARP